MMSDAWFEGPAVEGTLGAIAATTEAVENFLEDYCRSRFSDLAGLNGIATYALPDIGLRIRPFLLRASYEPAGGCFDAVLPIAAGIELIQISTLVLDDILDDSPTRNGRPSVLAKCGIGRTIALGATLSSAGFVLLSDALNACHNCKNKMATLRLLLRVHEGIYEGQFIDLEYEGNTTFSEEQYLRMISKTTAFFIQAPLVAGAMLWNAPEDVISVLQETGFNLGMAYQLRDDVVDIIGDTECTGKPVGGDIRARKMRLPVIYALSRYNKESSDPVSRFLRLDHPPQDHEVREIIDLLSDMGAVDYVIKKTRMFCQQALWSIQKLSPQYATLADQLRVIAGLISSFDDAVQPGVIHGTVHT